MFVQRKGSSLTLITYVILAGLVASTVLPGTPAVQPADAYRTITTGTFVGQTVSSFEVKLPQGQAFSNQTLGVSLNVSTVVGAGSINVSGKGDIPFTNLSGWGGTTRNGENYGQAIEGHGDYNNDSYPDLAIGADFSSSFNQPGRVDVFWGGPTGFGPRANWTVMGQSQRGFGFSLAHGDYNLDGIDDLVVGGQNPAGLSGEQVQVFYGSDLGLPASSSLNLTIDPGNGTTWGYSLAGNVDLNGDLFDDLVVGDPAYQFSGTGYMGRITVLWGGPTGLDVNQSTQVNGSSGTAYFGMALAALGDTDADGAGEVVVGAQQASSNNGRVTVLEGQMTTTALNWVWEYNGSGAERAGYVVRGGLNITGSPAPDLLVTAPTRSSIGTVYIFAGTGNANYSATPAVTLNPATTTNEQFGAGADIVGDIDGDGFADVVVGANAYNNFDGRIYVYTGGNFSAGSALTLDVNSSGLGESYGWRVSGTGDGNLDGYDDFAVNLATGINGTTQPGSVRAHYGGPDFAPRDVSVFVGNELVWTHSGTLSGNRTVSGLGPYLQSYVENHTAEADGNGNVLVPISFNFSGGGILNVSRIDIRFSVVLPPVGVVVTAPAQGRSLTVGWDLHATDGTVFNVWSNATGSWEQVGSATLPRTSYTVTGLTDGVEYWFYVTETDPLVGLTSGPSAIVSGIPQDTINPAAPRNFSLVPSPANHSARLSWSLNSDDTIGYQVWRKTDVEPAFTLLATVPSPGTSYDDTGLSEEVTYSYYLRAIDPADLQSPATTTLSMTINDLTPPPVPQNVVAQTSPSGTAIDVSWDANTQDTVSYEVLFGTVNDTASFTAFGTTASTSLSVTGLNRDNTYYVAVRAVDKVAHRSGFSNVVGVLTVDTQAPFAPTLTSATPVATGNAVRLEWTSTDDDIDGFSIRVNQAGSWVEVKVVTAPAVTTTVTGLTDGQPYEFRLAAFDKGGRMGTDSNSLTATPADTVRPGAPPETHINVVPAGGALTITWSAPSDTDIAGYNIYFLDPYGTGGFTLVDSVGPGLLSWTQEGLTNGLSYSYEVTAFDEVPNESPAGPRVVAVPLDTIAPQAPVFDAFPQVTNHVSITVTGRAEAGLQVQVFLNGALRRTVDVDSTGNFSADLVLGPGENSVTAKALDPDPAVAPQFRTSPDSGTLRIVLDTERPTLASRTPLANANNVPVGSQVAVTFSEPVDADSLVVQVRDTNDNVVEGTLTVDPSGRNAQFTPSSPLAEGMQYTVTISGTDVAGNSIDAAAYSFTTAGQGSGGQGSGGLPGLEAPAAIGAIALVGVALLASRRARRDD